MESSDNRINLSKKLVVVINGKGGTGKDTVCGIAAQYYKTRNVSSITPVKEIAKQCGWNGEKDNRSRKFLSDLKQIITEYNDLPNTYLLDEYKKFIQSDEDIMFAHIREGNQIDSFKARIPTHAVTLIIRSQKTENSGYGNKSDDEVENYDYDYHYVNDKPRDVMTGDVLSFLKKMLDAEGIYQIKK